MKKKILTFVLGLMGTCGMWAQSAGDQAFGINLGLAPYVGSGAYSLTNFQLGVLYQYSVVDNIRLEGDLNFGFKDKGIGMFDVSGNVQYLFNPASRFTFYPFVGIGYGNISGWGSSSARLLFNIGLGGEYSLPANISVGLRVNYQYVKDLCRLPIAVYATYRF